MKYRNTIGFIRKFHKLKNEKPLRREYDPSVLVKNDLANIFTDLQKDLSSRPILKDIATYYFDGRGKLMRPMLCFLMSRATNSHQTGISSVLNSQREIAKIAEMVHVSTLLHDDVIDDADHRRGKTCVHLQFSNKEAVMGGDFIFWEAINQCAKLKNEELQIMLSEAIMQLIQGEFMQLNRKEDEKDRFNLYIQKSFHKTGSLIAFCCRSVALLSGADKEIQESAYQYGRKCGIAFQLIDDILDFTPNSELGKPGFNDLKSGIATAPVFFACQKFPELNELVNRKFKKPGDVDLALDMVNKSNGLQQTKELAGNLCLEAVGHISKLKDSDEKKALILLSKDIINRNK